MQRRQARVRACPHRGPTTPRQRGRIHVKRIHRVPRQRVHHSHHVPPTRAPTQRRRRACHPVDYGDRTCYPGGQRLPRQLLATPRRTLGRCAQPYDRSSSRCLQRRRHQRGSPMLPRDRDRAETQDPQHHAYRLSRLCRETAQRLHQVGLRVTRLGRYLPRAILHHLRRLQHLAPIAPKVDPDFRSLLRRKSVPVAPVGRPTHWPTDSDGSTAYRRTRHHGGRRLTTSATSGTLGQVARCRRLAPGIVRLRHSRRPDTGRNFLTGPPTILGRIPPPRRIGAIRS